MRTNKSNMGKFQRAGSGSEQCNIHAAVLLYISTVTRSSRMFLTPDIYPGPRLVAHAAKSCAAASSVFENLEELVFTLHPRNTHRSSK